MKYTYPWLLLCFLFACRKDIPIEYDNYIVVNGTYYVRPADSDGEFSSNNFRPYYDGVSWTHDDGYTTTRLHIANTCVNNRGVLSNFYGYIMLFTKKGNDSASYYNHFPLFTPYYKDSKRSFAFTSLKLYRAEHRTFYVTDTNDVVIVSGKVTSK